MALALSTSWNAYRHTQARQMLFEIKELGFEQVELSFNLTASMVDESVSALRELGMSAVSLHNYCPIPEGFPRKEALPDCYSLSSLNEEERAMAVKFTKRTIDTASSLAAKAVVLHCGRVEIADKTRELIALFDQGKKDSPQFRALQESFCSERSRNSAPYLDKVIDSLGQLSSYAADKGVSLGVENRFYFREIPSFEEAGIILQKFKGRNVFYWHDTGHARVMQNLGFFPGCDFLGEYSAQLLGVHLHNIKGCSDHQSPTEGEIDFKGLKPYIKGGALKVIEAHYPANPSQVRQGKTLLESVL